MKKLFFIVAVAVLFLAAPMAKAASTPILNLSNTSGDTVQVTVYSGDARSSVILNVYPASNGSAFLLGLTDSNGYFTTQFNSVSHGITGGAYAYVTINGQQSATLAWPYSSSALSFSQSQVTMNSGQSITITANGATGGYLSSNSNSAAVDINVHDNNLITLLGKNSGNATIVVCSSNIGCGSFYVTVQTNSGANTLPNVSVASGQSINVALSNYNLYGNYYISSNSNGSVAYASINNDTHTVTVTGNQVGSTQMTFCQNNTASCVSLWVTVYNNQSTYNPNYNYNNQSTASFNSPVITSPYSNQTLTNYPRTLTVTWQSDNAPRHNIEVTCDYCNSTSQWTGSPWHYYTSNYATSFSNITLPGDNWYRVRVQAIDTNGNKGAWSSYVYFKFST